VSPTSSPKASAKASNTRGAALQRQKACSRHRVIEVSQPARENYSEFSIDLGVLMEHRLELSARDEGQL
jgi:hypothetical protein